MVRILALLALAGSSAAVVLESLAAVPTGWKAVGKPAPTSPLLLSMSLKLQNLDQLTSALYDVSTPSSKNYGKHYDMDSANALVAPSSAAAPAVMAWLKSVGITQVSNDGQILSFAAPVSTMNKAFAANFTTYQNGHGTQKIRTLSYSIPNSLQQYVDFVSPTVFFGRTHANSAHLQSISSSEMVDANCSTILTPTCVKELYNVGNYTPSATSGSRVAFGSFLNQTASQVDLQTFENYFNIPSQNFSVQTINGGIYNPNDPNINDLDESNLDSQNMLGVSHPIPMMEFITGGVAPDIPNLDEPLPANDTNEPYLEYYQYLLSQPNSALPQVISNSYGDDEQTVPIRYAQRVCYMIAILGLRGISVLESSGDTGVGGPCKSNDGKNTTQFTPQFPGTCPFVTAVGGTQQLPEVAWIGSSGGFSNYFSRPFYQNWAVETYFAKYLPRSVYNYYRPYFNPSGRGFPDISAASVSPYYAGFYQGQMFGNGGTSAASPVVGGIIALLNDARFRAGITTPLGFLNPLLYSIGQSGIRDITQGGSIGCNQGNTQNGMTYPTGGVVPYASWNATVGWDPVTGLGVPDFGKLVDIVTGQQWQY